MTREEIRANTSMKDLLVRYGITVRSGRCKCFVHGGHNLSMSIYKDKIVHCFKCGVNLDVFAVVQHFENCTFAEAMERLGGKEKSTVLSDKKPRISIIEQTRLDVLNTEYNRALETFCACDCIITYYEQTKDEKILPFYNIAMSNISYYENLLAEREVKLFEFRARKHF